MKSTEDRDAPRRLRRGRPVATLSSLWVCVFALSAWSFAYENTMADPACEGPREVESLDGHTIAVDCDGAGSLAQVRGPARRVFFLPIDANRADAKTLESLPEIGPARAKAWVEQRSQARFRDARDLRRIPGIGPRRAARLAPLLNLPALDAAE